MIVLDEDIFLEIYEFFVFNVICGFGCIEGCVIGIVVN